MDPKLKTIIDNVNLPDVPCEFPIAPGFKGERILFQLKGALFLYVVKRSILHDATGLGKTIEMALALHFIQNSNSPLDKIIWVTNAGAMQQLKGDLDSLFKIGDKPLYEVHVMKNAPPEGVPGMRGPDYRKLQYYNNLVLEKSTIVLMNYRQVTKDYLTLQRALKGKKYALVLDEAHYFKNPETKTHEALSALQVGADRVHAMTATPLMKELLDLYGIFSVVEPGLFQSRAWFEDTFCRIQKLKLRTGRSISKVVGHKNLGALRDIMRGRALGREPDEVEHQMAGAFPEPFISIRHVDMYPHQKRDYDMAEAGLVQLPAGEKETTLLSKLIYCQLFLSDYQHYGKTGKTAKMDELLRMVKEDFHGEKVVVFTRFETVAAALKKMLMAEGIQTVRITGQETADEKERNRVRFQQEPADKCRIMVITLAGGQSLNLQSSRVLIFYDMSYNAGVDRQVRGRILRYKSNHPFGLIIYMVTKNTLEEDVYKRCSQRYQLAAAIRGKDAPGTMVSDVADILRAVKERRGALGKEDDYFEGSLSSSAS